MAARSGGNALEGVPPLDAPWADAGGDAEDAFRAPDVVATLDERSKKLGAVARPDEKISGDEAAARIAGIRVKDLPWKVYTYPKRSSEELRSLYLSTPDVQPRRPVPQPRRFTPGAVPRAARSPSPSPDAWFGRRSTSAFGGSTPYRSGRASAPLDRSFSSRTFDRPLSPDSPPPTPPGPQGPERNGKGTLVLEGIRPPDWHAYEEKTTMSKRVGGAYLSCKTVHNGHDFRGIERRYGVRPLRGGAMCMMRVHHFNRPARTEMHAKKETRGEEREDWELAVKISRKLNFSRKKLYRDIQDFKLFSGRDGKVSKRELMDLLGKIGFKSMDAKRYIFHYLDDDHTESVSFEEFALGIHKLKETLSNIEAQRVLKKLDEDGNGFVNRADIIDFFRHISRTYEDRHAELTAWAKETNERALLDGAEQAPIREPAPIRPPSPAQGGGGPRLMRQTSALYDQLKRVEHRIHEIFGRHGFNNDQMMSFSVLSIECTDDPEVSDFIHTYSRLLEGEESREKYESERAQQAGDRPSVQPPQSASSSTKASLNAAVLAAAAGRMWGGSMRKELGMRTTDGATFEIPEASRQSAMEAHDEISNLYKKMNPEEAGKTPAEGLTDEARRKRRSYAREIERDGQDPMHVLGAESSMKLYQNLYERRASTATPTSGMGRKSGKDRWKRQASAMRITNASKFLLGVKMAAGGADSSKA